MGVVKEVMSPNRAVLLTGSSLTLEELVAVARRATPVQLDRGVVERMDKSRAVVERAWRSESPVYGLTTGVASLKRVSVESTTVHRFNHALVREHRSAQDPTAPPEVARAATLMLTNQLASGVPGVRPLLAERLVTCLNDGTVPAIRCSGPSE